jgi:deoxyribose-phosphate aldolase
MKKMIKKVDYTSLVGDETFEGLKEICKNAVEYKVASVCVYPKDVNVVSKFLENSGVKTCSVVSFPYGNDSTDEKCIETLKAIRDGADEIDMVFDYRKLMNFGDEYELYQDVKKVKQICSIFGKTLKVIIESGLLSEEQTRRATEISIKGGADFVKTSTGKVSVGAEIEKVKVIYETIYSLGLMGNVKIKASGGIRTKEDMELFNPFVDRFGMGYGSIDNIMKGTKKETVY